MGVYDVLPGGQQVKCWASELEIVEFGDGVMSIDGEETYSIALREGGYANIEKCILMSITKKPEFEPLLDKYGNPIEDEKELKGEFGEEYLFENIK